MHEIRCPNLDEVIISSVGIHNLQLIQWQNLITASKCWSTAILITTHAVVGITLALGNISKKWEEPWDLPIILMFPELPYPWVYVQICESWGNNFAILYIERYLHVQQLLKSSHQSFFLWLGNAVSQRERYQGPSAEWRTFAQFHESYRLIFRLRVYA